MPHAVTITGSRSTSHRTQAEYGQLFDAYLQPFVGVIGFPHGDDLRSGTWYTIRYGAEQSMPRLIVPI